MAKQVTKKKKRGSRKKRPSPTAAHAKLRELWATPEFRARMQSNIDQLVAAKRAGLNKRTGTPTGMTKAKAAPLWKRAGELADRFIKIMKDKGELPEVEPILDIEVPDTDAGKAEAALREAFVLAVGPSTQQIKIQAINTVLNFTKSKPESKAKLTLNKAEDFLDAVANDMANDGTD